MVGCAGLIAMSNALDDLMSRHTDETGQLTNEGEFWAYDANNIDFLAAVCPWFDIEGKDWDEMHDLGAHAWDTVFGVPVPPPPPPKQMDLFVL